MKYLFVLDGRQAVSGKVFLDEELLADGNITFFPSGAGSVASGGTIRYGTFDIPRHQGLTAGTYKVSITASFVEEPVSTDPNELIEHPPEVTSLIPKNYNSETTLTAEIEEATENFFTFRVKSQ